MTKQKNIYLTATEWQFIRGCYLSGESIEDIIKRLPSDKQKVSPKTIANRMSSEGLSKIREAIQKKANEHLANVTEEEKKRINEKCRELYDLGAEAVKQLLQNSLQELDKGGMPKGQARATAYNLDLLMSGVTKIQKGYGVVYGMGKDGQLQEKAPEVLTIEGMNMDKI